MKKTPKKFEYLIGAKIIDTSTDKYNNLSTIYIETKDKKKLILETTYKPFCVMSNSGFNHFIEQHEA